MESHLGADPAPRADASGTGQRFAAELLGTFVLVLLGCGAAVMSGFGQSGYVTTGLAFGFAYAVMAYSFGRISGGHFNPALSVGVALGGRLPWRLVGVYVAAQLVGALLGGLVLWGLLHGFEGFSGEGQMAQNSFGEQGSGFAWWAAFLLELVMTAILVTVFLAVTDGRNATYAALAPLAVGLTYALLHFASLAATGTSVNPARSLGVGAFAGVDAILQLWLFVLAPLLGAVVAGLVHPLVFGRDGDPVPGSGLSIGGRRRAVQQYGVPPGYAQPWPPDSQQPGQGWGQPGQQWAQPDPAQGAPQQWGQPQQGQQWGPPSSPQPGAPGHGAPQHGAPQHGAPQHGAPQHGAPQPGAPQPGAPQHWGQPGPDDDEDGRTQIRRPD